MRIVIGTIIVFFGLDTFLRKYGHRRITMESAWIYSKIAILWVEHIALLFVGFIGGWFLFRFKKKKRPDDKYISKEEIRSIIRTENIDNRILENTQESVASTADDYLVKEELICPEWGKEFVNAIGQVWLEKNFGTSITR